MNIKKTPYLLAGSLFVFSQCGSPEAEQPNQQADISQTASPPNVVFILIDDLGYKDLGCYGSEYYETPNIDRLATQGVRFTQAYAASAVSSPTRASILTGKHPARLGITDWSGPEEWHPKGTLQTPEIVENFPYEETSLAEALKAHDYTSCYLGKWHLGPPEYHPDKHGFDICIAATNAGAPPSYFYPYFRANWEDTGWPTQISDLVEGGKEGEYLTDRLTDEASNFLDTIGNRPFLLYLAHYAVHTPLEAKEQLVEKYRQKAEKMYPDTITTMIRERNGSYTRVVQNHAVYAAMIESVDESVGRLMDKLDSLGLAENTIVIFTSDNGGYSTSNFSLPVNTPDTAQKLPTSVLPLRTGKGWYYEGGIRIPTIIRWPGVAKANSAIDEPIVSTDFYPSILDMLGLDPLPKQHLDGVSFADLLRGNQDSLERDALYWHYPHYHNSGQQPASAIRKGKYKLVQEYDGNQIFLFDVENDIHEDHNLADEMPELRDQLLEQLNQWKKTVNARMPE